MAFNFTPCGCCGGTGSGCSTGVLCFRIRNSVTSYTSSGGGPIYDDINVDISSTGGGAYGNTTTTTDGSYRCINGVSTVGYRVKPTDICGSSSIANCNWNINQTFMGIGTAGACTTGNITLDYCCTCYCVQVTNYPYNGGTVSIVGALHNTSCTNSDFGSIGGNICPNSGYYCSCTPYSTLSSTSGIRFRNYTQGTLFPATVCVPNGSGGGSIYGSNCDTKSITFCDGSMNNFTANFSVRQTAQYWIYDIACDKIDYSCSGPCGSGTFSYISNKVWEFPRTLYLTIPNSMSGWFGQAAGTTLTLTFDEQNYLNSINNWLTYVSGSCFPSITTIGCNGYGAIWDWTTCFTFSSTVKSRVHWQLYRNNPFSPCSLASTMNRKFWIDNYLAATCLSGYRSTMDLSWIFPTGTYCPVFYQDFGGGLVLSE